MPTNEMYKPNEESTLTVKKKLSPSENFAMTPTNLFAKEDKTTQVQLLNANEIQEFEKQIRNLMDMFEATQLQY